MTISSSNRKAGPFTGNGVTVAFPFAFKVFTTADVLVVQAVTATGVETTLALGTNYTVALNADQNANPGGTITMLVAPATGTTLTATSQVANLQSMDLTNAGGFYPKVLNDAADRAAIQLQQTDAKATRALKFPVSDTVDGVTLPPAAQRVGKALVFDASGNVIMSTDNYVDQLSNVTAQAGAASASASASAGSAAASAGSAAASSGSASTALSYLNDFKGRYYGVLTADPALDPLGNAPTAGDLYFNSVSNAVKVYNAGVWAIVPGVTSADLANATDPAKGAALVGIDRRSIYDILKNGNLDQKQIIADAICVATAGAAGVLTGTFEYCVTFVTASGETEVSGVTSATVTSKQINLSSISISPDASVIARRIYRTKVASADTVLKYLVTTINDNTTTTFVDNVADAALGASCPRINTTGGLLKVNGVRLANLGSNTTAFGLNAHPANSGYTNSAFGALAMAANTEGYRNCAFGVYALTSNTTGARNTAAGVHSLGANTTANDNTAFGYAALINSTGANNTAVGSYSQGSTTTGVRNTSVGTTALQLNTAGEDNTAIGMSALQTLGVGYGNTAIGSYAGFRYTSGNFNVFLGNNAGANATSGSTNLGIGFQSLYNNISGSSNVAIGPNAGYWETGNNALWIDNQPRTNLADAKTKALVWGSFGTTKATQQLSVNGLLNANAGLAHPLPPYPLVDYTQLVDDAIIICRGTATLTLTLLSGAAYVGRIVTIKNITAFAVNSASANIIPLAGGGGGTAILSATAGKWAQLQYDGSNWTILMAN